MPKEFDIPSPAWPEKEKVMDSVMTQFKSLLATNAAGSENRQAIPSVVVKGVADIATNAWKAQTKMLDSVSGEVRDEMKRVYRHIESILKALNDMGVEVQGHTGDAFDYGMSLNVVTTQPTPGIGRESVTETIKPTIRWHKQTIQMGEVVIATPATEKA